MIAQDRHPDLLEITRGSFDWADDAQRNAVRERLLQCARSGEGIDWHALVDVHEHGW
jgi:hypothetical protein